MIVMILTLKIINVIVAIFAFATTTSFRTSSSLKTKCNNESNPWKEVVYKYSYPFDLQSVQVIPGCNATPTSYHLGQSETAPAQFYVFVGVIAFLYCIGALILYIFFDDLYRKNNRLVIVDFVISVVVTALWLISSSAWAQGVSDVKFYTDPSESGLFQMMAECEKVACEVGHLGNFASLNVSIIFGFLNFLVWAANLWFLYKETPWFKIRSKPPSSPEAGPPQQPPTNQY
ncbi:synaptophysin-like protein 2 isoform X2 [Haliotis rufescens]|uniref:synaptophysin-like protein 2 isoform X2 n=1 Tax=Haliotis rufescens TaxID=6454 RepID=UPI00201ED700|nr:synaptophysin-like protein 2 isoform X2 [Haliotis rufescens]